MKTQSREKLRVCALLLVFTVVGISFLPNALQAAPLCQTAEKQAQAACEHECLILDNPQEKKGCSIGCSLAMKEWLSFCNASHS